MSISKTKNGTYRLRIYIPEEVKSSLGIDKKVIEKRFKQRSDAKKYELELQNKIDRILNGESALLENNGSMLFSEFYQNIWWESYKAGQTTSTTKPPSQATIDGTEIVFRKHILPMLGNYSIDFLNNNKQVVLNLLTQKAEEYANFKLIRSYVNSIFDWAWKKQQKSELASFNIMQTPEQYVFTYIDTKGNVNSCLHADYLNNKMKSVKRRHPELAHATPHKLRHTGATLAKQAGTSMEAISEALTHSDTITTKTYVNTSNVIPMAVGEIAYRSLNK